MIEPVVFHEIYKVLQLYFDGLYYADSHRLRKVFHPDACYVSANAGDYLHYMMQEYFEVVDQRAAPSSQSHVRNERVLSIEHGVPNMAFVKVSMTMYQRDYIDFLSLIYADAQWRIISKIFTYTPSQ